MKRKMASILALMLLNLWLPCASAEISQDLDPMVSPDAQATVTNEGSENTLTADPTGAAVGTVETPKEEKKVEETKKESKKLEKTKKDKTKKSSKKKSSEKKQKKSSSKNTKKHKKSSNS